MLNFVRAATAVPKLSVADADYNVSQMIIMTKEAAEQNVHVLVFPELCISSYTCEDLFLGSTLAEGAKEALGHFLEATKDLDIISLPSLPIAVRNQLFNCAALCHKGKILGIVPKMYLPNSWEFGEKRWFSAAYDLSFDEINILGQTVPMGNDILFNVPGSELIIGVEICRDLWEPVPPSSYQALAGANVILNPTASSEGAAKHSIRRMVVNSQSMRTLAAYVYAAAGIYESTSSLLFSGHSMICENGAVLAESQRFDKENALLVRDIDLELILNRRRKNNAFMDSYNNGAKRDYRFIPVPLKLSDPDKIMRDIPSNPYLPGDKALWGSAFEDILSIQSISLAKRLSHIKAEKCVLGVSGGLDSALALIVAVKAIEFLEISRENIIGIVMPGFGSTDRAIDNAHGLMEALGVSIREISIKAACEQHFKDIGHDPALYDIVFENSQARERTQVAMDIANKEKALQLGTGNMSELALGFSTFGGDHISMYNVNCGVPKSLLRAMVSWIANTELFGKEVSRVLNDILDMPISPELLPPDTSGNSSQITEEILGPYEVNDFFLFHMLSNGFSPGKIVELAYNAFEGMYSRAKLINMLKNFYRLFFTAQFKRSSSPDGPKVLSVSLSSRGDWRMPSDASYNIWVKKLEEYEREK